MDESLLQRFCFGTERNNRNWVHRMGFCNRTIGKSCFSEHLSGYYIPLIGKAQTRSFP